MQSLLKLKSVTATIFNENRKLKHAFKVAVAAMLGSGIEATDVFNVTAVRNRRRLSSSSQSRRLVKASLLVTYSVKTKSEEVASQAQQKMLTDSSVSRKTFVQVLESEMEKENLSFKVLSPPSSVVNAVNSENRDAIDSEIKQENDDDNVADSDASGASAATNDSDKKSKKSGGFDWSAAAGASSVILVCCAAVWVLVVRPKQQKIRDAKRKTIEMMDCMQKRHAYAEIQKRVQMGEFDWEEANPVYDGVSKASVEAVTIAVSVAATDNVSIAHPKLHVLLDELGMGSFVNAFAAHGIRTTKHWIDLDEEAQNSILIDLGVKKGLSTDQCELFMDRMDEICG
jgi:hypothetical protein